MQADRNPWNGQILKVSFIGWFLLHTRTTRIRNEHVPLSLAGCVKSRVWQNLTDGLAKVSPLWETSMCPSS